MIRPSELRIGNYVKTPYDKYSSIRMVNRSYISDRNNDIVSLNDCEPIPLIEEWLERFGFGYLSKNILIFNKVKIRYCRCGFVFSKYSKIKHVHQLQNLYFALVGEELKLEE